MSTNLLNLLQERCFLPLFLCQLFSTFCDNFFRTAFVTFATYYGQSIAWLPSGVNITLSMALFIAPHCLLSAIGGQLGDVFNKSAVIRWVKLFNIPICLIGIFGFMLCSYAILLFSIFLIGVQSAIFSSLKYSILPEHLHGENLIKGNGLVEGSTFIAILFSTILGGIVASETEMYTSIIILSILTSAICAYVASLLLPNTLARDKSLKIQYNILTSTVECIRYARTQKQAFLGILGISWFWLIGAVFMAQIPTLTKEVLGYDESVFIMLLAIFSIGTGIGSIFITRMLKNPTDVHTVPTAILLMTIVLIDLYTMVTDFQMKTAMLEGIHYFLSQAHGLRISIDFFLLGFFGGIYIVPLYSYLQVQAKDSHRARILAANNIMNSLFMLCASALSIALLALGLTSTQILFILTVANLFTTVQICKILPDTVIRNCLKILIRFFCNVQVRGMENYYKAGDKVLIVANHASFIDPLLIGIFIPERLTFAIDTYIAKSWWIKPFLKFLRAYPIDPSNPMATKTLIDKLKSNKPVVIFPEGRITVTGSLMKVYEGPGLVAEKAGAMVLPIRIEGAEFSLFSRMHGKLKIRLFPKIKMTILEPRKIEIPEESNPESGRRRRHVIGEKLYDIMSEMMFSSKGNQHTVIESLIEAKRQFGGRHYIASDINKVWLTYNKLLSASVIIGYKIKKLTQYGERIGIFLPNACGSVITIFGAMIYGRVPAMLNFSTGIPNLISCCKAAQLKYVYTSRAFVEQGELKASIKAMEEHGMTVLYLEDIKASISLFDKIRGFIRTRNMNSWHSKYIKRESNSEKIADIPAIILFTSGSEGTPKGVVLSHNNLITNLQQLSSRVDFSTADKLFNALPIFHSFGFTAGTLLPLLSGVQVFLYPSPLHYRIIPELVYGTNCTIFFGTDTFLAGYAKFAHPYDFFSIRYVFAGAEKLREETRKIWMEKFGIRILEGYGATEASPAIAVNTPMHFKLGSVGRILPNIKYKILPVEGIANGGRLIISGPNIMLGYMKEAKPGEIEQVSCTIDGTEMDRWYDTGDIVSINEEGFISIIGREKRFAKTGGEMISLSLVEEVVLSLWASQLHAAFNVPDAVKGESILLVTDYQDANRKDLIDFFKSHGYPEIFIPKDIKILDTLPVLATGKIDYVSLKTLLREE